MMIQGRPIPEEFWTLSSIANDREAEVLAMIGTTLTEEKLDIIIQAFEARLKARRVLDTSPKPTNS